MIELMVAMAIFGILLAVAMPRTPKGAFALWGANQQLMADLRTTRADALTHGDHYRLDVTGANSYAEYRMTLVGNQWLPQGTALRGRTLPSGVSFTAGVGTHWEFNTRGLLVTPDTAGNLVLQDGQSHTRTITVWPSGQVVTL